MSPSVPSVIPSPAVGSRRRTARGFACAFFVFHLAAITMANVSRTTALGSAFHRPFDPYLALTRLDQTWDMFTTIPHFRDMGGSLVAIDEEGKETRYGPLLPGLLPYQRDPRLHGLFLRLAFYADMYPGSSVRYLVAVCRAIAHKTGQTPEQVGFELSTSELRPMAKVREDGRISETRLTRFGPVPCRR